MTGIIFAGECIGRFTNRKIPYCVKFNPDEVMFCNHFSFLLFFNLSFYITCKS